ncbi:hypothetical protein D9M71_381820 [compost metagenome]
MDQDLAVTADQEGMAHAAEVQGVDDLHQGFQAEVAADHAERAVRRAHRGGEGDDQLLGRCVDVWFGQGGAAGGEGVLVPGAGAWVVAVRHRALRTHGEGAVLLAQVAEIEGGGEGFLLQQGAQALRRAVAGDGLRGLLDQQQPAAQPVLDIVRRHSAHLVQVAFEIGTDGVALQVVVVQGEEGERGENYKGSGKENLVTELESFHHAARSPDGVGSLRLARFRATGPYRPGFIRWRGGAAETSGAEVAAQAVLAHPCARESSS